MQAIILAAGMGRRLGNLTARDTKCMLEVHGRSLIERSLDILCQLDLTRVIIVVGFAGRNVVERVGDCYKELPIVYVNNPIYEKTNNIYSLYLTKELFVEDDTLLLESDLIYEKEIIDKLLSDPFPNLAVVDTYQSWMDGTVVTLNESHEILSFIPKKNFCYQDIPKYFKTVNIYKFSKSFINGSYLPFLEAYSAALGRNEYYEQVLRVLLTLEQHNLKALCLSGEKWYEIDDVQDLNNAETIFAPPQKKLEICQKKFGGYWRYPYLRDFCYLVNPYFPTPRLQHEMEYYFKVLLSEYPSGQKIQQLLAAKMFGCRADQILAGNGSSELIFGLLAEWEGDIGVVYPTFNEYPQRMKKANVVPFIPANKDFSYDLQDLKNFLERVDTLLLINPDNPSGNFIPKTEVLELIRYMADKGKVLILDESFVDFSEGMSQNSLIDEDLLDEYQNLIIIKSISKSYGIPGARLGVVVSSNREYLERIRQNLSIWNINSFGEFFLQIIGKYADDYALSCRKIGVERARFFGELSNSGILRPIKSQANYFLCEVMGGVRATVFVQEMLDRYDIFIKDCSGIHGFAGVEYVRIAVRDQTDNDCLIEKMQELELILAEKGVANEC